MDGFNVCIAFLFYANYNGKDEKWEAEKEKRRQTEICIKNIF